MKLTINLATRRYVNLRQLNAGLLLGFLLLGGLAVYKVRELADNQAELARLRHLSGTSSGRGGSQVSEAQLKALKSQIQLANAAIDKKSLNWLGLLDRLEEVVPNGVTLTQIEPGLGNGLVQLSGAARAFGNLRTLLENMEHSPHFSEVYLLSQSETKVGQTQQGLLFSVSCKVALP